MPWPWERKRETKLETEDVKLIKREDAFVLDIKGHIAIGVALPVTKSRQIAGEVAGAPGVAKVAGKYEIETEQRWFVFTDEKNPLLRNYEDFTLMAAKGLTQASGSSVQSSKVVVSGVRDVREVGYGIDAVFVKKEG
jgi:hypothetical protein